MKARLLLLPWLLLSCSSEAPLIGTAPPRVDVDVDPDACDLDASDSVVEVDDGSRDTQVTFSHACPSEQEIRFELDDPDDAFSIDVLSGTWVDAGEPADVQIELIATEPGTYEAQITAELTEFGESRTIEVIGIVYGDDG